MSRMLLVSLALPALVFACAPQSGETPPPTAAPVATGTAVEPSLPEPAASAAPPAGSAQPAAGPGLVATLETPAGPLVCHLFDDKAPNTVANFVGLAEGTKPWKDWNGAWVTRPAYDGTTFHRIIRGFMIQGGDPNGPHLGSPGTGEPGFVIDDEIWKGASHDRAGLLCMANRGPDTNGMQFFITDAPATNLDGGYTIFGECAPVATVHKLAAWPVQGDQAINPPVIAHVTISHGGS